VKPTRRPSLTLTPLDVTTVAPDLPPSLWRIMRLIWQHGPLTAVETHRLSPAQRPSTVSTSLKGLVARGYLTTALEATGGRPRKRYYPCVDYSTSRKQVVRRFLDDYLFSDPTGLALLAQTVQQNLSAGHEPRPSPVDGQSPNRTS